jgi:leucyl-tRNA synthetase
VRRSPRGRNRGRQSLAPIPPYLGEELWRELGHRESIHLDAWPQFDPELTRDETVTVVVQVNGKVRDRLQVPADISEDAVVALGSAVSPWRKSSPAKPPRKVI